MTTKRGRACVCFLPDFNGNLSKFVHIQNFQLADAQQCSNHDFVMSSQQLLAAHAHRGDRLQSAVKPHTRTYRLFFTSSTKQERKIQQKNNKHLCKYQLSNKLYLTGKKKQITVALVVIGIDAFADYSA